MNDFDTLLFSRENDVALVTINRPEKLNALSSTSIRELSEVFAALEATDSTERVRAVVLTGAGDKAFVAGADIEELSTLDVMRAKSLSGEGQSLALQLERCSFPVIAAVNGFALGGGCELALACDFIYSAETAMFGQPEVGLGVIPGFGGTQRLARRVGLARARELIFTGARIDAQTALRIGLVNEVVARAELVPRAMDTAKKIATRAPLAVAAAKRVMNHGAQQDTELELEALAFASLFSTADAKQGLSAFLSRTPVDFRGL
jgi:enoyl-CoA hydratase